MWDGEDRRQFYRVTDRVALRYARLRDDAAVASAQARLSLHNRLAALDRELAHELSALAEQSPRTHHVAKLINEKLAMVMSALDLKEYPDDATLNPMDINISAAVESQLTDNTKRSISSSGDLRCGDQYLGQSVR